MKVQDFVDRAGALVEMGNALLKTTKSYRNVPGKYVDRELFAEFRASSLTFLEQVFGSESTNFTDFNSKVSSIDPDNVRSGIGILNAAKDQLAGGWLTTTRGLLSAEIFSDIIDMGEHLLAESYKDAAAVVFGTALEAHLRQLAINNGIDPDQVKAGKPVPKKADLINSELAKANIYNKLDQKNVTAMLDLRNKAAHGHYGDYTQSQVELMRQSLADFLARVPV